MLYMYKDLKIHVKNKLDNYLYIRCIHVLELFSYMSCSSTYINMYLCFNTNRSVIYIYLIQGS